MVLEEHVGTVAFEALQRLTHRQCRWQIDEAMHMVRHDLQLDNVHARAVRRAADRRRAHGPYWAEFARVTCPLELPDQVETILSDRMI